MGTLFEISRYLRYQIDNFLESWKCVQVHTLNERTMHKVIYTYWNWEDSLHPVPKIKFFQRMIISNFEKVPEQPFRCPCDFSLVFFSCVQITLCVNHSSVFSVCRWLNPLCMSASYSTCFCVWKFLICVIYSTNSRLSSKVCTDYIMPIPSTNTTALPDIHITNVFKKSNFSTTASTERCSTPWTAPHRHSNSLQLPSVVF